MNIRTFENHTPVVAEDAFIADSARVIGNASIDSESSIWFGAVLRADADSISIGKRSNVQDNAVVHVDPGFPVVIGDECIIGHSAIIHGATLHNNVLVGMHATLLNGVEVGEFSIIGANALVTSNTKIPPFSLVLGSPATVVKSIDTVGQIKIKQNADDYCIRAKAYLKNGF